LFIPVYAAGGLFSAGDAHFAQGDNETCGTAIEMRSTLTVRFAVHKGRAAARGIQDLQFARDDYYLPPEFTAPRRSPPPPAGSSPPPGCRSPATARAAPRT